MLRICLVFWKSEPQYAYKRYAYKKNMYADTNIKCPPNIIPRVLAPHNLLKMSQGPGLTFGILWYTATRMMIFLIVDPLYG